MCECPCPRRSGHADVAFWPLRGSFVTVSQRQQRPFTLAHPCFSEQHNSVSRNTVTLNKPTTNHEAAMLRCYYTRVCAEKLLFKRGWYGLKRILLSLSLFDTSFVFQASLFSQVSPVFTGGFSGTAVRVGRQIKPEKSEETTFTLSLWQIIDKWCIINTLHWRCIIT